mgnify:CR=1 FL=1
MQFQYLLMLQIGNFIQQEYLAIVKTILTLQQQQLDSMINIGLFKVHMEHLGDRMDIFIWLQEIHVELNLLEFKPFDV